MANTSFIGPPKPPPLQVGTTYCRVTIQPPEGVQLDWDPSEMVMDLRHVHTHNDLAEACGTFTLTLAPRAGQRRTADAAIPLGSLVTIRFVDPKYPQMDPRDEVVMIGRTERQLVSRDYSQRQVRQQITITGRSVASAMLAQTWYHAAFEDDPASGSLRQAARILNFHWLAKLTADAMRMDPRTGLAIVLKYFLGLPSHVPQAPGQETTPAPAAQGPAASPVPVATGQGRVRLTRPQQKVAEAQHALQMQQALAAVKAQNPAMTQVEAEMAVFRQQMQADMATQGAKPQAPRTQPLAPRVPSPDHFSSPMQDATSGVQLVNWQIPGVVLADVLDINNDQWTLFEEGIRIPISSDIAITGSVWNLLHIFIDPMFQEFFTRMQSGLCAIHFRGKPFLQKEVSKGTRFVAENDTLWTVTLTPGSLLRADLERGVGQGLYNIFRVFPLAAQPLMQDVGMVHKIVPTVFTDEKHPSNVLRWGPHPLNHKSPYLNGKQTLDDTPDAQKYSETIQACINWGKILSYWYGWTPELYAGTLTVLGSPVWNVGLRLFYDGPEPSEAYIEGVDHDYTYDPATQSGRYLSQLRVSRWWTLAGRVDRRWQLGLQLATPNGTAAGTTQETPR